MSGRKAPPMSSAYSNGMTAASTQNRSTPSPRNDSPVLSSPNKLNRSPSERQKSAKRSPPKQSSAHRISSISSGNAEQMSAKQPPAMSQLHNNNGAPNLQRSLTHTGAVNRMPPAQRSQTIGQMPSQRAPYKQGLPMPPADQQRPNQANFYQRPPQKPPQMRSPTWDDDVSESSGTADDIPQSKAGAAGVKSNPNIPAKSYALLDDAGVRTNLGNTSVVMALLSEMWIFNLFAIGGGIYCMTFLSPTWLNNYIDDQLFNISCLWKIAWVLPLPYSIVCFVGLIMPFRTPKFLYDDSLPKRRIDNLYILTVTKGDNRDAVYRSWNAHKHLERLHPCVRVHVLTDEPYFFENINCYTCPKAFQTRGSKYKARALEWYRQTMRFTEHDWVLHLDEESVIDDESVKRILEFIWYEHDYHWGQGIILYNQYNYWKNWIFTVADAIRVGDDLARFQLQYSYFHRPVFGAHGSFLLTNGAVENDVTWDLGSLTEDYEFAMQAWYLGYKCGKVPGIIREQSPMDLIGFLKQRRRWYVGIRSLPHFLPKLWALFWTVGTLALYGTIISIPLGIFFQEGTPRWFGLCKDFSFVNFVYLYLIGIFIQEVDRKTNPLLLIVRVIITFPIQFIASIMEAMSVTYGIFSPPNGFDVIKK